MATKPKRVLAGDVGSRIAVRIAQPELLGLRACEDLTGISHHTWRRYCYDGIVSSVKIGDRLLVPWKEVQRIIKKGYRPSLEEQKQAGRMTAV